MTPKDSALDAAHHAADKPAPRSPGSPRRQSKTAGGGASGGPGSGKKKRKSLKPHEDPEDVSSATFKHTKATVKSHA